MVQKNTRRIGKQKEQLAAEYLQKQQVELLERNYYTQNGELDLIGRDQGVLVFFEVKYRKGAAYGSAAAAVNPGKCKRMVKAARHYLFTHGKREADTECRFDVIAIDGSQITWIRNAFSLDMLGGFR